MINVERDPLHEDNIKGVLSLMSFKFAHSMPLECRQEILSWPVIVRSPNSYSFYDITNKNWDDDYSDTFLRFSDHWNFENWHDRSRLHCQTESGLEESGQWLLGQFNPESRKYRILKRFDRDKNSLIEIANSINDKEFEDMIINILISNDPRFDVVKFNLKSLIKEKESKGEEL
jgi:hypothetical protein